MPKAPLSLYIHVPFCRRKCAYCDFASYPNREGEWRQYFDTLMAEIRLWSEITDFGLLSDRFDIETLYIGGGTPTLVPDQYITRLMDLVRPWLSPSAEVTIEGNPGTLSREKLSACRRAGINRLSLGAQSFDDKMLRDMGRIHSSHQIKEGVDLAREAGFDNINLDLIYAWPGQEMDGWMDTLNRAIDLGVEHISAYSLIVEPGTQLAHRVGRGEVALPEDELVIAMQRSATRRLKEAGFDRYEISNYAVPGFESRHNLTYWRRGDYLGLGCAAHSMIDNCRFHNPESLEDYLRGMRRLDFQRLTEEDIFEETVMLGTRTIRGLDVKGLSRPLSHTERLQGEGLIEFIDGRLSLTERGLEVQNAVVLELL